MRVAIVADVHSNLAAFRAVADDFGTVDEVWCLGDVVGYGPRPNECLQLLRQYRSHSVAGNHDLAAVERIATDTFNPEARQAAAWTASQLTAVSRDFLLALPLRSERDGYTLVHGSPRDPVWEYLIRLWQAEAAFADFSTPVCLIGHSHVPLVFEQTDSVRYVDPDYAAPLDLGGKRWIVNPGSVGQPRDGDPDASYVLLDTAASRLEFRRVPYDVAETQSQMRAAGLPDRLWQRLSYGL